MYKEYDKEELKRVQNAQKEILKSFDLFCKEHDLKYFLTFGTLLGAIRHKGFIPWDDDIDVGMLREDYDKFIELAKDGFGDKYEVLTPLLNKNYCSSVTHVQNKKTTFVSEGAKDLKCHLGINIDIFVYDNIPDDKELFKKQCLRTIFYGRLLYLRGSGNPEINLPLYLKIPASIICKLVHYGLIVTGMSSVRIYNNLLKHSKKYNSSSHKQITCFEDATPDKNVLSYDDLYPLQEIEFEDITAKIPNNAIKILINAYGEDYMELPPLEKRVNHAPIIVKFEDEN